MTLKIGWRSYTGVWTFLIQTLVSNMNEIASNLSQVMVYTRDRKVKDNFGCSDLENLDTVNNINRDLGIPKVDLVTKYKQKIYFVLQISL